MLRQGFFFIRRQVLSGRQRRPHFFFIAIFFCFSRELRKSICHTEPVKIFDLQTASIPKESLARLAHLKDSAENFRTSRKKFANGRLSFQVLEDFLGIFEDS